MDLKEFPGVSKMEMVQHGPWPCIVVVGVRPIHDKDEKKAMAVSLGVDVSDKNVEMAHIMQQLPDGQYRTAFYIGPQKGTFKDAATSA